MYGSYHNTDHLTGLYCLCGWREHRAPLWMHQGLDEPRCLRCSHPARPASVWRIFEESRGRALDRWQLAALAVDPNEQSPEESACVTRLCEECGEPFHPRRSDAAMCSPRCRVAKHRRREADLRKEKA